MLTSQIRNNGVAKWGYRRAGCADLGAADRWIGMNSVLLVVFDGLRPDAISAETTPNLLRFAAMGHRMARARSVFPSETRVCTSAVATGCHPQRHGLVANKMIHPLDPTRTVDTGDGEALRDLEQALGAAVLQEPGLSDRLGALGHDFAVFSSGTTGQTFLLAPRADRLGQVVVSAHGPQWCSIAGQSVLARLDPPPSEPTARAVWIAEAWRRTQLPNPPAASVLWLCEPDTSSHYQGLDSAAQRHALKHVDAAFGRIVDEWQAGPQRDRLQIIVASDHGHVAIERHYTVSAAFARSSLFQGVRSTGGASAGLSAPDATPERLADIATWLMQQDWIETVLAANPPPGALPLEAAEIDHPRTARILYTMRSSDAAGSTGLPGLVTMDNAVPLKVGGGSHGGLNRAELSTVLMMAGSAIQPGVSQRPAGLVDIAPSILALLGLPGGETMDGRVIEEALAGHQQGNASYSPETWEAHHEGFAQRVARWRMGRHVWLEHGERLHPQAST